MSPVELMFARKIQPVFDNLIPSIKENKKKINTSKTNSLGKKNYFLNYHLGKATWLEGIIEKRMNNMMKIIKHPWWKVRRHINHIKKWYIPHKKERVEEPMPIIYDIF